MSEVGEWESVQVPAPTYGDEFCLVPGIGLVSSSHSEMWRRLNPAHVDESSCELIETLPPPPGKR